MIKRMEWYSRKHFVILNSILILFLVLVITQAIYFKNLDQYFKQGMLEWSKEIEHLKFAIVSLVFLAIALIPTTYVVLAFFKNGKAFSKKTLIVALTIFALLVVAFAVAIGDQYFWKTETHKILSGQYATGSNPSFLSEGHLNQYSESIRVEYLQSISDIYVVNIIFISLATIGVAGGMLLIWPYWSEI